MRTISEREGESLAAFDKGIRSTEKESSFTAEEVRATLAEWRTASKISRTEATGVTEVFKDF